MDTTAADALRPAHQRELVKMADAASRRQLRQTERKRQIKAQRESPWRHKESQAAAFSYTDYINYQTAIKTVLKGRKWKRKLAQGKNAAMPVL
jgi:hypothetical protein